MVFSERLGEFIFICFYNYSLWKVKMRPTWFLDVDGVINALSKIQQRHFNEFPTWEQKQVNGFTIRYSPEVVDFINRMSERVDIKWNTTWHHQAVDLLSPVLGLKPFEVAQAEGMASPGDYINHQAHNRWWKMNSVLEHIESGGLDFIWTDDHLTQTVRHHVRRQADFEGLESCMIIPDGEMGLTRGHLERIEKFVDTLDKYGMGG
jgi:hypothetical protein